MIRVVVVGGGMGGLATAWFLAHRAPPDLELSVRVVEDSALPGGKVRTSIEDGIVFEHGPHGFLGNAPDTRDLIDGVGLSDRCLESRRDARRRFVLADGRLRALPRSPLGLLSTDLLSFKGRMRLLKEPFAEKTEDHDESVASFFARRLGPEVVENFVEPFVTGVWAGDASRLSLKCAFPKLALLEREHGGLLKGVLAGMRAKRKRGEAMGPPSLHSFIGGMGELPLAVGRDLGDGFLGGCRVASIARDGDAYAVEIEGNRTETLRADVLVMATPLEATWGLLDPVDPDLGAMLRTIPTVPIAVACLTWPKSALSRPLDAFGFLCARREKRPILGCIFSSSVFDGHAPDDTISLRVLMGGAHATKVLERSDDELLSTAEREIAEILGFKGGIDRRRLFRHPRALPQYNLGHIARLAAIDGSLRMHPNMFLAGAAYRGTSVNDCIRNGRKTASHVLRHLLTR